MHSPKTDSLSDDAHDGVEPQRRKLIINALVLSEYRKIIFKEVLQREVNPIVLFKSANKNTTKTDMEDVIKISQNISVKDFDYLKKLTYEDDTYGVITGMFAFLENNRISLSDFAARIRIAFRPENMIIYNSSEKTTG